MKRVWAAVSVLALVNLGCPLDEGGGGGGGGPITFNRGYAFMKDDRNVYLADESDFSTVAALTTTGNARHPSLSKDGRRVVFVQGTGADAQLMVVATSGGTPSLILASTSTAKNFRTPVFSPDGTKIVFAYDEGASSVLGVVGEDGSGFAKLAGGALSYASPSFFPDGTKVLAAAGNSLAKLDQLESIALATGSALNLTNTLGNEASHIVNRVVISPDGTQAAFDGRLGSGSSRIFVMNLSTKKVTQLTEYPGDPGANDSFPSWVSNTQVGFSSDTGGANQVYALPSSSLKTSGGLQLPSAMEPWFGPL